MVVTEIIHVVGFSDLKHFRTVFQRRFGTISPPILARYPRDNNSGVWHSGRVIMSRKYDGKHNLGGFGALPRHLRRASGEGFGGPPSREAGGRRCWRGRGNVEQ